MATATVRSHSHAQAMPSAAGSMRNRYYSLDDTKAWAASSSASPQKPSYLSSSASATSSGFVAPHMHASRSYSGNASLLARPTTASSVATCSSSSSRPWIRDSDAASVRSASGQSSDGSGQEDDKLSIMSPAAPPPVPFLSTRPQPVGCRISVDASSTDRFTVVATLPGFSLDNITLALKRNGSLHILADRYDDGAKSPTATAAGDDESTAIGGHFERMVELGESAIGARVSAEFDGKRLRVTVMKRDPFGTVTKRPSTTGMNHSRF